DCIRVPLVTGVQTCALPISMLLGGLWHGASWSFLLWGGLHGSFLIIHKIWCDFSIRDYLIQMNGVLGLIWKLFCWLLTFHCVCLDRKSTRLNSSHEWISYAV